jgi:tRNA A-37 threonylcarbamoyl transferase component Bud32
MPASAKIVRGDSWGARLRDELAEQFGDCAKWMQQHTQVLKTDSNSLVGLLQLQQRDCYLKLYRHKSALHKLRGALGGGRPLRAFDMARDIHAAGIAVPRPLACLGVPEGMLLLTEGISGAQDLQALWKHRPEQNHPETLLPDCAALLGSLHRAGFAHGDCKWSNLLAAPQQLYLVDLDGARKTAPGSAAQARDLARFTLNAEELSVDLEQYEQFLSHYLQASGFPRDTTIARMQPMLRTLRERHLARYGERGHRLF